MPPCTGWSRRWRSGGRRAASPIRPRGGCLSAQANGPAATMHFTPDARANALTLEAALARLAASPQVDGLALFGSRATDEVAASDYDVLILVKTLPVGIFQMLTHIGGRM